MGRNRTIDERQILDTARDLFLLAGAGLPTRAIARALRISESVLYQRFGSKDALFYAAMAPPRATVDAVLSAVSELGDAVSPVEARRGLVTVAFELLAMFRQLGPVLVAGLAHRPGDQSLFSRWQRSLPIEHVRIELAAVLRALDRRRVLDVPDSRASAETLIVAAWGATQLPSVIPTGFLAHSKDDWTSPAEVIVDQLWSGIGRD